MRRLIMLVGAVAIVASAGCAKKENASSQNAEQSAPSGQTTPEATHEVPTGGHAENEQVNTAGSIADLMGRVHDEEHELDQIIASAQLSDVHKKAFAIRDLLVAAADKADPSKKAGLQPHLDAVKATASALDEAGDSGDLAKTKSEYQKLLTHVKAIEGALGVAPR